MLRSLSVFATLWVCKSNFNSWFDDQHQEVIDTPISLTVEGELPSYLTGVILFRLGPTIGHTSEKNVTNYIDSFGRITKWKFGANSVDFQSAIIRSNLWNSSSEGSQFASHITQEKTSPATYGLFDLGEKCLLFYRVLH